MLVYTFRTCPYQDELKMIFPKVFVFSSLKRDMKYFEALIASEQGNVIGIAGTKGHSRVEPIAINKFNRGKVVHDGPEVLNLCIDPRLKGVKQAGLPTTAFCNWTMYKIQRFLDEQGSGRKLTFVHLNSRDLGLLSLLSG